MQLKSRILLATVASACISGAAIAAEHKGLDATSSQVDAQEAAYMKALKGARTFENRATRLLINTKAFDEPLSFVPAES